LAEHFENHPATHDYPFLVDLAKLEFQVDEAFHGFHQTPLSQTDVRKISEEKWADIVIQFQPYISSIKSDWHIYKLWTERDTERQPIDVSNYRKNSQLIVGRNGFDILVLEVTVEEHLLFLAVDKNITLGALLSKFEGRLEPSFVTETFRKWMQYQLLRY